MHTIETNTMPVNLRQIARRAVLKHKGYSEQTLASVAKAKADCEAERKRVMEATGLFIGPDGSMHLSKADFEAWKRRREIEAVETVAQLVAEYGSARVSLWMTAGALRAGEKL